MKLIVNADDLGYSAHRDRGIFNCFNRGLISAASLLVNGPCAVAAALQAGKEGLFLGLHLNFTEGYPVSENVKSLVGKSGQLKYKMTFWNSDFDILEICRETIAQIELFKLMTGQYPTHVDGHQHVHIIPKIAEAIAPILKKYGVKSVRIPDEDVSGSNWLPRERQERYVRRYVTAINARLIYKKSGITAPECFRGLCLSGELMTAERLAAALEGTYGTVELMVHPGFVGYVQHPLFNDDFDISEDRENELQALEYFKSLTLSDWS